MRHIIFEILKTKQKKRILKAVRNNKGKRKNKINLGTSKKKKNRAKVGVNTTDFSL